MLQAIHLAVELDPLSGPLFQDLNLSVVRGEKVALVGANGTGKSTLLRMLTGQLQPSSGRIILKKGCTVAYLPQDLPFYREGASPGERMRQALHELLAADPDILLLDEPTNHLDLPARGWLEAFIKKCRQGVLAVTHDRSFADEVADRVLELENGLLREYAGGYSAMLNQKSERLERELGRYERERSEMRRLKNTAEKTLQRAGQMTKAPRHQQNIRASKTHYAVLQKKLDRRAKAIRTRVEQIEDRQIEKPFIAQDLQLKFPTAPLRSPFAVQARGLTKAFGRKILFEDLALDAEAGQRVAVVGANGAGKTTLLHGLLEPLNLDAGEVVWGSGARPSMLSQERIVGDPELTILEALEEFDQEQVRNALGSLGMRGDAAFKQLGVLSVGERSRVELVRILLSGANVLLLDEPTNHLDLSSLEAVERALESFRGTVIFISHDRRFIETYADRVVPL